MILSNVEIHRALDDGRLGISPQPLPRFPEIKGGHCPYGTHTVDLCLAGEIHVPNHGTYAYDHTQAADLATHISKNCVKYKITTSTPFRLNHGEFVLGRTLEEVRLPIDPKLDHCLAARIEGKSSRARTGLLIHFTAPTVHPGWEGPLVLEMINLGACPILLSPGMAIAQLIVEEVRGKPTENPSIFQGQTSPSGTTSAKPHPDVVDPLADQH